MMAAGRSTGGRRRSAGPCGRRPIPQAPQQPPGEPGQQEPDEHAVRHRGVQARTHIDQRQRGHLVGSLLGQGRGHQVPHGMPDHRHRARAEPVQRGTDPAGVSGELVPAGRARRPAVAEQVDTDNAAGARQGRDYRVPPGRRAREAVDQQHAWSSGLAALHHMQVTIGQRHEPAVRTRIAGQVLRHRLTLLF